MGNVQCRGSGTTLAGAPPMITLRKLRQLKTEKKSLAQQEPVGSGLPGDITGVRVKPGTYHFKGERSFLATSVVTGPLQPPDHHPEHEDLGRSFPHEEVRLEKTEQGFTAAVRGQVSRSPASYDRAGTDGSLPR